MRPAAAAGLDGVTVDFESVYRRDLPAFGRFVDSLGRAIRAHNPIGRVTVAVGASQAGVAMAAAALAGHADRVLIMGYDYRSGQLDDHRQHRPTRPPRRRA